MNTIFKTVVGSRAYGTSTPESDTDFKGVYVQPEYEILTNQLKPQIEVGKDEVYYEVARFLQLLETANPTVLEMLFMPKDCVISQSPVFDLITQHKEAFLTKKCKDSFGGYAVQQLKKAKGLDKKMNWEQQRVERKTPLDFMYATNEGKTRPITKFLEEKGLKQEYCGLVALNNFPTSYAVYYDHVSHFGEQGARVPTLGFKGIIGDDSNEPRVSSVPKFLDKTVETVMYYNKDGYSQHCKDYNSYQEWLTNRNTARYTETQLKQKIDGKNLLHCRRLLDMALEIPETGTLVVQRPNTEYLLSIRRGEVNLDEIISQAEKDIEALDEVYKESSLPDSVDPKLIQHILYNIRTYKA